MGITIKRRHDAGVFLDRINGMNRNNSFMLYLPLMLILCGYVFFAIFGVLFGLRGMLVFLFPLLFWLLSFFIGLFNIFHLIKERNAIWKILFTAISVVLAIFFCLSAYLPDM